MDLSHNYHDWLFWLYVPDLTGEIANVLDGLLEVGSAADYEQIRPFVLQGALAIIVLLTASVMDLQLVLLPA